MTHESRDEHRCPICGTALPAMVRYPNYVCGDCVSRAVSESGRPVGFTNESISGGILAFYPDTGDPYASSRCWIDGMACEAREAKFGGIVLQPVDRHGSKA